MVLALLAAFALVWLVLLARDYAEFKLQTGSREPIRGALRALAAALDLADANRAVTVMQATEIQYNQLRRNSGMSNLEDLLFRLERPDGTPIYASTALGNAIEQPMAADPQTVLVGTRRYWKVAHDTAHWRLTLLEPAVADTTALQMAWPRFGPADADRLSVRAVAAVDRGTSRIAALARPRRTRRGTPGG